MENVRLLKIPAFWFFAVAFIALYVFKLQLSHVFLVLAGLHFGWEFHEWIKIENGLILILIIAIAYFALRAELNFWHAAAFVYGIAGGIVFRLKIPRQLVIEGDTL